jgi:hypothetical protein
MPLTADSCDVGDYPRRSTAMGVLTMRNRLKMFRVHARVVTAEVIKFQTFRDRTYEMFVGEAVGQVTVDVHGIPIAINAGKPEPPISSPVFGSCPEPTLPALINLWHEAINRISWSRSWLHALVPSSIHQRLAMNAPSISQRTGPSA